jgi:hypothetical protein
MQNESIELTDDVKRSPEVLGCLLFFFTIFIAFEMAPKCSTTMLHLFIYAIFILCAIHGIQTRSIQNDTLENRIVALEKLVEKLEDRIKNGTISSRQDI